MDHFDRAVERLQKLDSNLSGDSTIIDRVTQHLAGDIRGVWSARDLAKDNAQGSKDLPVLPHGSGSKGNAEISLTRRINSKANQRTSSCPVGDHSRRSVGCHLGALQKACCRIIARNCFRMSVF